MRDGRMHQTTVRFGPDLWEALERECRRLGVSAAQYLREAALTRLAYTAGRRRDTEYEAALLDSAAQPGIPTAPAQTWTETHAAAAHGHPARTRARELTESSERMSRARSGLP
jgi:hypothetical protein